MMVKIFIGAAVVVAALVVLIALQPDTFHVERSVVISAPPERAYAQVIDFHKWQSWSPYEKLDPAMKRSYAGAPSGSGAVYSWAGTGKVGEGRMTIVEAVAPSRIGIKLDFIAPMSATNRASFTFKPEGSGTKATWAMDGKSNFLSKAFHLVMNMDKLVGTDFAKGLESLKANAESAAPPAMAASAN